MIQFLPQYVTLTDTIYFPIVFLERGKSQGVFLLYKYFSQSYKFGKDDRNAHDQKKKVSAPSEENKKKTKKLTHQGVRGNESPVISILVE